MSVFIVVQGTIKDKIKFEQYAIASRETIQDHKGCVVARGVAKEIHGHLKHPWGAIIEFPNRVSALSWYQSEAYQSLMSLREEASDSSFALYDGFGKPA